MGVISKWVLGVFLNWSRQVCGRFRVEIEETRCIEAASRIWASEPGGWSPVRRRGKVQEGQVLGEDPESSFGIVRLGLC